MIRGSLALSEATSDLDLLQGKDHAYLLAHS